MDICKLRGRSSAKDQLVAVKRLRPSAQIDLSQLANEGKILRTLRHRCAAALSLRFMELWLWCRVQRSACTQAR